LELALRFAQYALQPNAPAYVAAALHEAHALATASHPSWWSDLYRALAALPVPVALPIHAGLTPHLLADIARSLDSSLAAHIHASVMSSHRLPILAARFAFLPSQPPVLQALCKWRAYLNVPFAPHREALVRLLVSDHKLAVEALRRVSPQVPRHRRICRLCEVRSAIESELHVLLECRNEQLCAIRDAFYARILPRLPKLPRVRTEWTWERQFDVLLGTDAVLSDLAEFVYDVNALLDLQA
ncbi:hypothetical protein LXA43DRAFT_906967, partial [Ganoderma leucocontextum]